MARVLSFAFSGVMGLWTSAQACEFHGYTPDPTLVDILLGTEQVVIAQPAADDPTRYVMQEALLGPEGIPIPIPVTADVGPSETVLLAREEAYGPWLELAVLDDAYRDLIDQVIARQSDWLYGGDDERFQMFADLVNHPNPDIRDLALRELDRADYIILRGLDIPPVSTLRSDVQDVDDDLRPIRILLAGLSGDQSYVDVISGGLTRAVALDLPYLGAYATALIELQGPKAVKIIVDAHFLASDLPYDTHERLLEALAIKNQTARGMTSRAIEQGMSQVLQEAPELAGIAARQFGIRSDWSIAGDILRASKAHQSTREEDMAALTQYLEITGQNAPER